MVLLAKVEVFSLANMVMVGERLNQGMATAGYNNLTL